MEKLFYNLADQLINNLDLNEHLIISIKGENSQFIRFSQSKVRQAGIVDDASIMLKLINGNKSCSGSFTISSNIDENKDRSFFELNRLREEIVLLPDDPFIVLPKNLCSSKENHKGNLLSKQDAVNKISSAIRGVDLAGIWASGRIFTGNINSEGQKHWFSTDTFSLDYSLITSDEKMVKSNFAGTHWEQLEYEQNISDSIEQLNVMNKDSLKIKPGNYRTYIAPAGVADIIHMFSWGGVGEASIQQGNSSISKMRMEKVNLSPCFTLREDFTNGLVPRFNNNGELAPEKLDLILEGTLKNTLVSSRTSKEYGITSNFASDNESLRSPFLATGDLDENDILNSLGTGIYLSNLHYLNWSDRIGGRITGMTRYACFWIEDGNVIAPIENMRFDDSIYNFFGNSLEKITNKSKLIPTVQTYDGRELGGVSCPGILLKSFELTL